jgi:hypothetical protein
MGTISFSYEFIIDSIFIMHHYIKKNKKNCNKILLRAYMLKLKNLVAKFYLLLSSPRSMHDDNWGRRGRSSGNQK